MPVIVIMKKTCVVEAIHSQLSCLNHEYDFIDGLVFGLFGFAEPPGGFVDIKVGCLLVVAGIKVFLRRHHGQSSFPFLLVIIHVLVYSWTPAA